MQRYLASTPCGTLTEFSRGGESVSCYLLWCVTCICRKTDCYSERGMVDYSAAWQLSFIDATSSSDELLKFSQLPIPITVRNRSLMSSKLHE